MQVARSIRKLILGNQFIQSRAEFKRIILTGYLALICITVNIVYVTVDTREGHSSLAWLNTCCFLACGLALILIRLKRYISAKMIMLLSVYAVIFVFCAIEPAATGVSFFFILLAIGSIALFGTEQWPYAAGLSALGGVLFLITVVGRLESIQLHP
jgi:hypothetical protein